MTEQINLEIFFPPQIIILVNVRMSDNFDNGVDSGVERLAAGHAVLILLAKGVEDQLKHRLHVVRVEAKLWPAAHALQRLLCHFRGQVSVEQVPQQPHHCSIVTSNYNDEKKNGRESESIL